MSADASRSWLFVPGDSERKQEKAVTSTADVLIYDLEDAVAPGAKTEARERVRIALGREVTADRRCVRINPVSAGLAEADLRAVMAGAPDIIMVPKLISTDEIEQIDQWLRIAESEYGIATGKTRLLPLVTEVPAMTLALPAANEWHERVIGITWGAEDLAAELGASANRDASDRWRPAFELARSLTLMNARATNRIALDTVYTDFGNDEGLTKYARLAAADGFDGMLAIHPAQVEIINSAFTPSESEHQWAESVLAAFATEPDAGVVKIGQKMLDEPHRRQALRIVKRWRATNPR